MDRPAWLNRSFTPDSGPREKFIYLFIYHNLTAAYKNAIKDKRKMPEG